MLPEATPDRPDEAVKCPRLRTVSAHRPLVRPTTIDSRHHDRWPTSEAAIPTLVPDAGGAMGHDPDGRACAPGKVSAKPVAHRPRE